MYFFQTLFLLLCLQRAQSSDRRDLFVLAHPDDEIMFMVQMTILI